MNSCAAQKEADAMTGKLGRIIYNSQASVNLLSSLASSSAWFYCFLRYRAC